MWRLLYTWGPYGPQLDKTERIHEVSIWIHCIYRDFAEEINKGTKRETTVFEL
jgi:hypothetical protein